MIKIATTTQPVAANAWLADHMPTEFVTGAIYALPDGALIATRSAEIRYWNILTEEIVKQAQHVHFQEVRH